MENRILSKSVEKRVLSYLLIRMDDKTHEITPQQRDSILAAISSGARFIQIGESTVMVATIRSIDPLREEVREGELARLSLKRMGKN